MDTQALYQFLTQLGENNNREWFNIHKAHWEELRQQWLDDINLLIVKMSEWEPKFRGLQAKDCVFRIYRDIRFKADKSPYKTWVCAGISIYGKNSHNGGYYVQFGPKNTIGDNFSGLFGGVWMPERPILNKLRKAIVDNIEEFTDIINNPKIEKYFPGWTGPKLKKIPPGWDNIKQPVDDLLRLKEFGKACECDIKFFSGDWTSKASERLSILKPLVDFLNYSIEE